MNSLVAAATVLLAFASTGSAQWAKDPANSFPRTPDGKPNLSAPAPKAADGKVDLSGLWLPDIDPKGSSRNVEHMVFSQYFANIAADLKPEEVPIEPWARTLLNQRLQNDGKDSPQAHCKPSGVPWVDAVPLPYKIIQMPRLILILYEENSVFRQIFLDGRRPVQDAEPRWMGYSSGKWEGDVLVVDTVGINDKTWLDAMGHPHSENLHTVERFRRLDAGHIEIEVTIDDPKAYTKPITYTQKATIQPDQDLLEYFCTENERDIQLFK
jgi:hypothetical protein